MRSLTVAGLTRVETGAGSDTANIGTTGSVFLNDAVTVILGAGDDPLTIGASAASPALGAQDKFLFDGGSGVDTFIASMSSLGGYQLPLPAKLKSKITNFENLGSPPDPRQSHKSAKRACRRVFPTRPFSICKFVLIEISLYGIPFSMEFHKESAHTGCSQVRLVHVSDNRFHQGEGHAVTTRASHCARHSSTC